MFCFFSPNLFGLAESDPVITCCLFSVHLSSSVLFICTIYLLSKCISKHLVSVNVPKHAEHCAQVEQETKRLLRQAVLEIMEWRAPNRDKKNKTNIDGCFCQITARVCHFLSLLVSFIGTVIQTYLMLFISPNWSIPLNIPLTRFVSSGTYAAFGYILIITLNVINTDN